MMMKWSESVRKSKTLLVYNEITNTKWRSIFSSVLQSFNKLPLGIKAKQTSKKDEANVVMHSSDGVAEFTFDGQPQKNTFPAKNFHGYTMLLRHSDSPFLEKAAIFLPSEPQIRGGFKDNGDEILESPNLNQMRVIAVHELIHACGLDNAEHDDDGLFQKNLVPSGDKMASLMAVKGSKPMPPMYISGATKAKILNNWSL